MPTRPPTRCSKCNAIATKQGRCDEHQRKAWENPSTHTRTISRADQIRARKYMLNHGHACTVCGEDNADLLDLDHIIEVEDGGAHEPANWQLLCRPHHKEKTLAARRARNARRRAQQGR